MFVPLSAPLCGQAGRLLQEAQALSKSVGFCQSGFLTCHGGEGPGQAQRGLTLWEVLSVEKYHERGVV